MASRQETVPKLTYDPGSTKKRAENTNRANISGWSLVAINEVCKLSA